MILIMAAGMSIRWKGKGPKELVPIAGKPLILYTIEKLEERGENPIVITHKPEIQACVPRYFVPHARRWWPETLLSTAELWHGRVIILHADVCFSDHALNLILSEKGLRIYGTVVGNWETFALVFDPENYEQVKAAAGRAIRHGMDGARCILWELYRALCGLDMHNLWAFEARVWSPIDDFTTDFDTLKRYYRFLKEQPWAVGGKNE